MIHSQHRHTDSGICRQDTSKAQSFATDAVSLAASKFNLAASEFNLAASCISIAACCITLAASSLASCGVFEGWGFCEETCWFEACWGATAGCTVTAVSPGFNLSTLFASVGSKGRPFCRLGLKA